MDNAFNYELEKVIRTGSLEILRGDIPNSRLFFTSFIVNFNPIMHTLLDSERIKDDKIKVKAFDRVMELIGAWRDESS